MENANPSCSTSNRELLDPKKKREIKSWLEDSRILDSLDGSNEIEYFDTFPTLEELEYHEWLLKYPKPSWVFSTWMTFGGNTRDLSSFGEETDEITDLHQILEEVFLTERGDGVASIKRRRHDPSSDGVRVSDDVRT
ncbi:hypothetical protein Tco_1194689 [Tanacetum coccineum]